MGSRAERKRLAKDAEEHMAAGTINERTADGLMFKLGQSRDEYAPGGSKEDPGMFAYVNEIIRRIDRERRTQRRASNMRIQKRKATKKARKITRRRRK